MGVRGDSTSSLGFFDVPRRHSRRLVLASLAFCSGCHGLADFFRTNRGMDRRSPKCTALEGARVAIVCLAGPTVVIESSRRQELEDELSMSFAVNVKRIEMIPNNAVRKWRTENRWDEVDFIPLGQGLGADKVVEVELFSYDVTEKTGAIGGTASVKTVVYDLTDHGRIAYRNGPSDITHEVRPPPDRVHFERAFVQHIVRTVAQEFYVLDRVDIVADTAKTQ